MFLLDVDLIPDPGARTSILKHFENARSKGDPAALKNKVFVAPAFEMLSNASEIPPRNKDELISLIKQGHASPVHFSRFSPAHRATNYDRWYAANSSYMIDFELLYEPYVVVRCGVNARSVCLYVFSWLITNSDGCRTRVCAGFPCRSMVG